MAYWHTAATATCWLAGALAFEIKSIASINCPANINTLPELEHVVEPPEIVHVRAVSLNEKLEPTRRVTVSLELPGAMSVATCRLFKVQATGISVIDTAVSTTVLRSPLLRLMNTGPGLRRDVVLVTDNSIPCGPALPVAPVAPVAPGVPDAPVEPVAPVIPAGPVAPVAPFNPAGPVAPAAPVAPAGPVAPVTPAAPCRLGVTGNFVTV